MGEFFDEVKGELGDILRGGPSPSFIQNEMAEMLVWEFHHAAHGTRVIFTGRPGGVSPPPYESLNLGYHVNDDPANVTENRRLICAVYGIDPQRVTSPAQRHTAVVRWVENESQVGIGAGPTPETGWSNPFDPCDALLTRMKQVPLLLHFADCVPVVLTGQDGDGPLIAVIHAGRKGLVEGVIANAVSEVARLIEPAGLSAAVGAPIGTCCYEVDEHAAAAFGKRFGQSAVRGRYLDLHYAAAKELIQAGVPEENIHTLELCTSCDDNFFSYRRDGVTGRHAAIAWIE
jgi:hypothetical protein